ncbi:MAG TPA: SDR family NAD(P)-dependent oxidoreductase, partial [Solirubrobacterales bacterium]|nr:SDR family NAD(P)-dependent oxidoreductase [Solirubrobacterales bacterium]
PGMNVRDLFDLGGKVAIVTGGATGLGRQMSEALAELGADVVVCARKAERCEQAAAELAGFGVRTLGLGCDVRDPEQVQEVVRRTVDELGRLDILINNAGVMLLGPIVDAPVEEWEQMIEVNLLGLLYVSRAALPHLLKAAQGERGVADLVNISSVAGRVARLGSGVYNATKHGVGAFSESLRQEVTGRQVRISLIEPGAVTTELIDHNRPEIQNLIRERLGEIEKLQSPDIADAISYVVTRPPHVAINEVLIRPTGQTG